MNLLGTESFIHNVKNDCDYLMFLKGIVLSAFAAGTSIHENKKLILLLMHKESTGRKVCHFFFK